MKLLFPQGRPWVEAVMINSAGGITGGDRFAVTARAARDSKLTVTTQAAERAYRSQPSETARMETRLHAEEGAALNWLPQETILYDACRYSRSLQADLETGARFLMVEPLVFGRTGMGETLTHGLFRDRIDIRRDGQRLFYDATRLQGDIAATLAGTATGGGAAAMASLLLIAPDAETHLTPLRAALPGTGGATLLHPDVLYLRLLAQDSFELRKTLLPILDRLTGDGLPLAWRL
jgi:urease accessory protein